MARKFIIDKKEIKLQKDGLYKIEGNEVKHIQVLRKNILDEIVINEYKYQIVKISRKEIYLKLLGKAPIIGIPKINLTVYLAFLKGEKMDFVIQKLVELGCSKIIPFFSTNVIVKLDDKGRLKRKEKFQKIADEACKQCGRSDRVLIDEFISFNELISRIRKEGLCFFAYENTKVDIKDIIKKDKENMTRVNEIKDISCIIGAEGGFTKKEILAIKDIENINCISLGNRILRAETAAIFLVSIIMYEYDS